MILTGDCVELMVTLEANSVDAIMTDPPYGLEFMGKEWDRLGGIGKMSHSGPVAPEDSKFGNGIVYKAAGNLKCLKCDRWKWAPLDSKCTCEAPEWPNWRAHQGRIMGEWHTRWAREAFRVAKPGAHLLAFGGTRTYHRLASAIEDAGWEIRDCLVWAYASGFPKSLNLTGDWNGWGTALKPAWEPIVMARKPLAGTVAANVLRHGTGALNIDATRIEGSAGSGVWGSSKATADPTFNASATKHEFRSEQHPAGRWPANVVLTDPIFDGGVDGVVGGGETGPGAFPAQRGPTGVTFPLGAGGWQPRDTDSGTYSRFFLIPKAARSDREPVLRRQLEERVLETQGRPEGRTLNGDGTITTHGDTRKARENLHPTVKPVDLMRHLVRLVTPPGGTVLDCFLGSGTTAIACELEGFAWIGMEREPEYVAIAEARLNGTQRGLAW